MPPVRTQAFCPNCRQPVAIEVQQLFDLSVDPEAKNQILSGAINLMQCPTCKFQGQYPQPLVYHDPEKQLLLTYVPPELGLTRDGQEKVIGPIITKVVNALPQEKRKAYLLQPKTMLTMQTMVETIYDADGITKEMIQAQQAKIMFVQRLANTAPDAFEDVVKEEEHLLDREFFALLSALAQNAMMAGDNRLAERLSEVQRLVLPHSEYGKEVMAQSKEVEAAIASLQSLGDKLTRETLLDLVLDAPNDIRLRALVSLVRDGMDYQFLQILSQKMENAQGAEAEHLGVIRGKLLGMMQEYDQQVQSRVNQILSAVDQLANSPDPKTAMQQNMQIVDEMFLQVLEAEINKARSAGDLGRSGKLSLLIETIQEATQPPEELALIETLLEAEDEASQMKIIEAAGEQINDAFMELMAGLLSQVEAGEDENAKEAVQSLYKQVLRYKMMMSYKGG